MSFTFEALNAGPGDCLFLHHGPSGDRAHVVIDAGVRATWACSLEPRLQELRREHALEERESLPLELLVVSHIDEDHIQGAAAMLEALSRDGRGTPPWKVQSLWCNTFDEDPTTDDVEALVMASGGAAGVADGRQLRDLAVRLGNRRNGHPLDPRKKPFRSSFVARTPTDVPRIVLGDLTLTVLSPTAAELKRQQKEWDSYVKAHPPRARGGVTATDSDRDNKAPNLSSISLLAEAAGRRVLLPGDGRADQIVDGLKKAGMMDEREQCKVDVFKMPHHGSIRNVDAPLLKKVQATNYVFSGNGSNGNPDLATLELLGNARKDKEWEVWVTFARDAWRDLESGSLAEKKRAAALKVAQNWLDEQSVKVHYREPRALGVVIPLDAQSLPSRRPVAKGRPAKRTSTARKGSPAP